MEISEVLEKGEAPMQGLDIITFSWETLGVLGKGRTLGVFMDGGKTVLLGASGIVLINFQFYMLIAFILET